MKEISKQMWEDMLREQAAEVQHLVGCWLEVRGEARPGNLATLEQMLREWALRVGGRVLERLLEVICRESPQVPPDCPQCHKPTYARGQRSARLHTSLGDIEYRRLYARCRRCGRGAYPLDKQLGLDEQRNSAALSRMISLAGAVAPFEKAADLLRELGSVAISRSKLERVTEQVGEAAEAWIEQRQERAMLGMHPEEQRAPKRLYVECDGTTVPMRAEQLADKPAQRVGGKVQYKEVKLGAVFEAELEEEGRWQSTEKSYTGTFGDAEDCVRQLMLEGRARGSNEAEEIVLLQDGASWLWNRLPLAFAGKKVTQILDWCHPAARLTEIAKLVFGEGTQRAAQWAEAQRALLYEGQVLQVIGSIERLQPRGKEAREYLRQSLGYFHEHADRMNYGELRAKGYFIGSGVIESGCKHIVAERFKQAGMIWSAEHAPKLLALRICRASGWWEQFWKDRVRKAAA